MKTPRERMHLENIGIDFRDKIAGVNYYADTMLNKTITMFTYENLPESLPERELELLLQIDGKCIVAKGNDGELLALQGNYAPPLDAYYRSTEFIVANPWAKINKTFVIRPHDGKEQDAVLIRNDALDRGLLPIIRRYGALLTETDLTILLADQNFRAIFAIIANSDNEAAAAKEFLRQIEEGRQGTLLSEELGNGISTQPYSNAAAGYITQLIELNQYLKGSFYQEIGLDANYNMKRERLSESEAGLNQDILRPLIDAMLEERQRACEEINKLFGTNISVKFASTWAKYNDEEVEGEEVVEGGEETIDGFLAEDDAEFSNEESAEETTEEPEAEVVVKVEVDTDESEEPTEEKEEEEEDDEDKREDA